MRLRDGFRLGMLATILHDPPSSPAGHLAYPWLPPCPSPYNQRTLMMTVAGLTAGLTTTQMPMSRSSSRYRRVARGRAPSTRCFFWWLVPGWHELGEWSGGHRYADVSAKQLLWCVTAGEGVCGVWGLLRDGDEGK